MLDDIDQNILKILQSQGDITNHELGERAFISPSQAGRRKARLEEHGYISGYKAKVNAERVDLKIQAFIQLALKQHGKTYADHLHTFLQRQDNITNIWTLTGRADYLLQVYCRDLKELNTLIHDVLLSHDNIAHIESQIVMDHLKDDTGLPLS